MNENYLDTLVIDTFIWQPHIATSAEIAITEVDKGRNVGYCFLHVYHPDDNRTKIARAKKVLGFKYQNCVQKIEHILSNNRVKVLSDKDIERSTFIDDVQQFVVEAPSSLMNLKEYKYKNAKLGIGVVSSLISKTRSVSPKIQENRTLIQEYLYASATVFEQSLILIQKFKPSLVVIFNGRQACTKAIAEAASQLGVKVNYHERGATYNKYRVYTSPPHNFSERRKSIQKYWSLEKNQALKTKLAHQFFIQKRNGEGISWLSFTEHQSKNLIPSLPNGLKKITYYSSSDDEFASLDGCIEQPLFTDQREAIEYLMQWAKKQINTKLIIRVHPHLEKKAVKDRQWWNNLNGENIEVIPSDSTVDSYALIDFSDSIISYGSTVGIEASYWGKPSILIGDSIYSGFKCVYEPSSTAELEALLNTEELSPLPQEKTLPYGYYAMNSGLVYQYYQPQNLFRGSFMNHSISLAPEWYDLLSQNILYNSFRQKILKRV